MRLLVVALLAACGSDPTSDPVRPRMFGGDRPVELQAPDELEPGKRYPLVLLLHGYGASGFVQQAFFGMHDVGTSGQALLLAPDGLVDSQGKQFWNADPECCDFEHTNVDDVAYLGGLVDDVIASWPVDTSRVLAIGHSNGGFMSYRLACDRADVFTDVISLAGNAVVGLPCTPAAPVNVLHLHGTADDTVPYNETSVDNWAGYDACSGQRTPGATLDLDGTLPGAETQTSTTSGCPAGVAVELWKIQGAGHLPNLTSAFAPMALQWFVDHAR